MFEHILDCPQCGHRFHFEHEGVEFPATITCPECGADSPAGDFEALLICHECHVKIKVPVSILNEEDNCCPKCGAVIHNDRLTDLSQDGNTLAGGNVPAPEKKRMLKDGDFFDKFRIIKLLGRGGMAEVYLAEHLLLKQRCALKLMQRTLEQDDNPVFIKRFVREAKLTHSLNHPNIVKVFDAGSDFKTGYLFLAMEYVEGRTLHDIINENELSENELLDILNVMANALKVLEEAKVVHRDIKPSNIMYTNDGVYKLMDLGIAKTESNHQAGDMTLTMEQSTIGTPGYASPEQCSSAHLVDVRSDIFSLGASIYHAASGHLPFTGETPVATILNTMQKDPEPLRNYRVDLSDDFIALVEKMMKKKPAERFQNMTELMEAIGKVERGSSLSRPVRKLRRAITAIGTTIFASKKEEKKRFSPFRFILKTVVGLVIAAVAALHILYVLNRANDTMGTGYVEFMKGLVSTLKEGGDPMKILRSQEAPLPQPPSQVSLISTRSDLFYRRIQSAHPLVAAPEKELQPNLTAKGKRYAVINVEKLPKGSSLNEFSFKEFPAQFKGVHSGMFRDGMLDMTKSGNPPRWQTLPGVEGWSAFLNFQITKNEFAEIFGANGLEVFLLNGTLRLFYNGYYTDTRITVPPFKWMNLNFSVNTREGRIDLVSGDLLLPS